MRHDADGRVVEIGARTRTIPPALRRALQQRDAHCRFPGCHGRFTQGHHLRHWARGGPTTLANLALLCRRHHRAVHEDGYQVDRAPDGTLSFRRPDGQPLAVCPARGPVPEDAAAALQAEDEAAGLDIHPRTALPSWTGERLDLTYAIDVLYPRREPPVPADPPSLESLPCVEDPRDEWPASSEPPSCEATPRVEQPREELSAPVKPGSLEVPPPVEEPRIEEPPRPELNP